FLDALANHPSATPALVPNLSPDLSDLQQQGSPSPMAEDATELRLTAPSVAPATGILPGIFSVQENKAAPAQQCGEPADVGPSPNFRGAPERIAATEPLLPALADGSAQQEISTLYGLASLRPLGQLRDSFILAVNEEGLWIIDQHVAHERVLFERVLRERKV